MIFNPLETIKSAIVEELKKHCIFLGALTAEAMVYPPDTKFGDIALPCFSFVKDVGSNPAEVAQEILKICSSRKFAPEWVSSVNAAGPYVNFVLKSDALARALFETLKKTKQFGANNFGKGERVMIEYPSPNTHKEFHIGHVRNVCLGVALVHLYETSGFKMSPVDYTNDLGSHVAKCLWALMKFHAKEKPPRGREARWIGEIYAEGAQRLEGHPEYAAEVSNILQKLEARDPKIYAIWKKTRAWSIKGMNQYLKELGAKYRREFFESEVKDEGKKIVAELLKKGIAKKSQGAVIIDMEAAKLGVMLLLKSDGTGLYATSDLALARRKFKLFKIDRSINITDVRQSQYFKQLFRALRLSGFNQEMTHIGYEFVRLPEGAMASRVGRVILYEDMRDEIILSATEETKKRHPEWKAHKVYVTAYAIALAGLKFGMLKYDPGKVIVFDKKEALSFEGFTGPYVLYTLARIHSLLKKAGLSSTRGRLDMAQLGDTREKALALHCMRLPEVVQSATEHNNPSELAQYAFKLCQLFAVFYEHCPVMQAPSADMRRARLALVRAAQAVLTQSLTLLGIPLIQAM